MPASDPRPWHWTCYTGVTSSTGGEDPATSCRPGDFTVTELPNGYLVGRALEQVGIGPWWTYVLITETFDEAVRHACALAKGAGVRAWLHKGGEEYDPLLM